METLSLLLNGFSVAFTVETLTLALIGCFLGTLFGALPGVGPANGVAILIPLVFALELSPVPALTLLTSIYFGCMYGGRITSILLNIPGDESAVMTTLDGYPMTRAGMAGEALALSGIASFVGGFFAIFGLALLAPQLVKIALLFRPAEYFALFVLAFATLGGFASTNQAKSLFAAAFGLCVAMIGIDKLTGVPRFSFGSAHFYEGVDFIVVIIGIFALSEVFLFLERPRREELGKKAVRIPIGRITVPLAMLKSTAGAMARGTGIGFVAGVLPGAGAAFGSYLAYTLEKRLSDKTGSFGKGDPRGLAAPESGNNAAAGGALVPMLALGVPGSGTTAVLLAVLMVLNITPGPLLFQNDPDVVWGLIAALFIGNLMLLVLNIPLVGMFIRILLLPTHYLMPAVAVVCFVGVYGISGSTFDLYVMIFFGVLGYIFRKFDIPLVPVILGVLLGELMEANLRRALTISNGDWSALVSSPLAIGLWSFACVGFLFPIMRGSYLRLQTLVPQAPAIDRNSK